MTFEDYMNIGIVGSSLGFCLVTMACFLSLIISLIKGFLRKF